MNTKVEEAVAALREHREKLTWIYSDWQTIQALQAAIDAVTEAALNQEQGK